MSNLIATIQSVVGQVFVVSVDGVQRQVFEGERLMQGEQLVTSLGGEVVLTTPDGQSVSVGENSTWQPPAAGGWMAQSDNDLEQALAAGFDPTLDLEATAAGPGAGAAAGGAAGGGRNIVMLEETAMHLSPDIGYPTLGIGSGTDGQIQDVALELAANQAPFFIVGGPGDSEETPVADNAPNVAAGFAFVSEFDLDGEEGSQFSGQVQFTDPDPNDSHTLRLGLPTQDPEQPLTSGGEPVTWTLSPDGHTLTGSADGKPVVDVTLNNQGDYSVTLHAPLEHPEGDDANLLGFGIPVTVTDNHGASGSSTIFVTVQDSVPLAILDKDDITEDGEESNSITGNVLLNDTGQDVPFKVVGIGLGNSEGEEVSEPLNEPLYGEYGFVNIDENGNYSYTLYTSGPGGDRVQALSEGQQVADTFSYTMSDADGDLSTTTLTITITGTNDAPVIVPETKPETPVDPIAPDAPNTAAGYAFVDEGDLADGGQGVFSGRVEFDDPDSLDTHSFTLDLPGAGVSSGSEPLDWVLSDGGKTLTGSVNGEPVVAIVINDSGDYSVTLSGPLDHEVGGDKNLLGFNVPVKVTDNHGAASDDAAIFVTVRDSVPEAMKDTNDVVEDTLTQVTGNVLTNDVKGADVPFKVVGVATGDTEGAAVSGKVAAVINGEYGTVQINENGSYTYTLYSTGEGGAKVQALSEGQTDTDIFTYTMEDADGDPSTSTLTITVTGTNDAPIITETDIPSDPNDQDSDPKAVAAEVRLSESGLPNGIEDGNTELLATKSGNINFSDVDVGDVLTLDLLAPSEQLRSGDQAVVWEKTNVVDPDTSLPTGEILLTGYAGTVGGTEVISVSLKQDGSYVATLKAPIEHPINANSEQGTDDLLFLDVGVTVTDNHGASDNSIIRISIEDDAPSATNSEIIWVEKDEIPDVFVGEVSFKGGGGRENSYTFANGAVKVTGQGFTSETDLTLIGAQLDQTGSGLGVASAGVPYHNLSNEVDYRILNGQGASEKLIVELTGGKISYGVSVEFAKMYGDELEVGLAQFYRGEELVAERVFTSDAQSGNYAKDFLVAEGGFDKIVITALDNGQPASAGDNSDFTVSGITFLGEVVDTPIAYATGTLGYGYGADGPGGLRLNGTDDTVTLLGGEPVTVTSSANQILAKDAEGNLVYQIQLTPATGQWEFYQYQDFVIDNGGGEVLSINFAVTDSDGDGAGGKVQIGINKLPLILADNIEVNEAYLDDGSQAVLGEAKADGAFTINGFSRLESLEIEGQSIDLNALATNDPISPITVDNGVITILGYDSTTGQVSYSYQLTSPFDHKQSEGNDEQAKVDINITAKEIGADPYSTSIELTIVDDSPQPLAGSAAIVVPVHSMTITGFEGGFINVKQGAGTGTIETVEKDNTDKQWEELHWGTPSSGNKQSGYTFVDNEDLRASNGYDLMSGGQVLLGTFTHNNYVVNSGSAVLDTVDLKVVFSGEIDGHAYEVSRIIHLKHEETPNDYSPSTHPSNDDIITITNANSAAYNVVEIGGREFAIIISGFVPTGDPDASPVTTIKTTETESNSFQLYAQLYPLDEVFSVSSAVDYVPGADGVDVNGVEWWTTNNDGEYVLVTPNTSGNYVIENEAGTFVGRANGTYEFHTKPNVSSIMQVDQVKAYDFRYSITDGDGDREFSTVTVELKGAKSLVGTNDGETLTGTDSADYILGGAGDDIIIGGAGDDILWGGAGDDTFKWNLGDQGTTAQPAHDQVMDFGWGSSSTTGQDVLNLADLLSNYDPDGGNSDNLESYLHIAVAEGSTVISVSSVGGLDENGAGADQVITLVNLDLTGGLTSQAELFNQLVGENKPIIID